MRFAVRNSRSSFCMGIMTALAACLLTTVSLEGRASQSSADNQNADAFVHDVIHNEIDSQVRDDSLWCYREQQQEDGKPSKTLEVCQTKDGDLERLVAVNGRELNPAQRQAEDERIQKLISHPEQLRAKQKKER